jgi:F-type H+-transporting ATPase subunit b
MQSFVLLAGIGSDLADTGARIATDFDLNWSYFIAQCLSFSIVAFCLHRFAYQPIQRVLEDRKRRIAESLSNADKIKDELAKAEEHRKQALAEAGAQASKIIEEARAVAEKELAKRSQEAIATAEQIIAKAREAAAADHARMLGELKREVGRLVVETTARVSGKVLTMDDQSRLIEETNKQVAA